MTEANKEPANAANARKAEATEKDRYSEQVFLKAMKSVRAGRSDIAETMGDLKDVYAKVKNYGFTKADVTWAIALDEKDSGEVLAEMQRRLKIAGFLGHTLARQVEMFPDRTPLIDRAYAAGLANGKQRLGNVNPYDVGSEAGQSWQAGSNDGTAFINEDLEKVVSSTPTGDDFPAAKETSSAKSSGSGGVGTSAAPEKGKTAAKTSTTAGDKKAEVKSAKVPPAPPKLVHSSPPTPPSGA